MYLIYKPEGDTEPQQWKYNPTKLMSVEREALEKRTGKDFTDFTQSVLAGNGLCRRALLHMYLKRQHPTIKWDDVDFAWDELELQYSRQELQLMRDRVAESSSGPETAAQLEAIDREMADAIDEDDAGKASLPIAG